MALSFFDSGFRNKAAAWAYRGFAALLDEKSVVLTEKVSLKNKYFNTVSLFDEKEQRGLFS